MDKAILSKHIKNFISNQKKNKGKFSESYKKRLGMIDYYQSFTRDKILAMNEEDIYEYLSQLWAMLIWGNKHYVVDKIIEDNGLDNFKERLASLVWGDEDISVRWDNFRSSIKGMGPAMISEILCKTHPDDFMLWNRRAYIGLNYLKVPNLPRYDYQLKGKVYKNLCDVCKDIAKQLGEAGFKDTSLLAVDYFIWDELQVVEKLTEVHAKRPPDEIEKELESPESEFIHNDIRDKLRDIGGWLGFKASIEQRVSEGSKVDTTWEVTIGNMGRIIYVFEVQTKGSIDSMILNLLKSLNNPSVQGVVAVSDKAQLEKIKKHAADVKDLRDKLKYWDYEEVLEVHDSLAYVNETINNLGLVPESF